jgi:predicted secreted protein
MKKKINAANIFFLFYIFIFFAGCASTATIEIRGNKSVGDSWRCASIYPEGVISQVSNKYKISAPFPGSPGRFIIEFRAIAEGEAEIVLTHYFRGEPMGSDFYNAVVDKRKRLKITAYELENYSTVEDAMSKISGTWYNRSNKTAIRFLENTVQIARNIEDPENADFADYAAYTVEIQTEQRERYSVRGYYLIITKIPENEFEKAAFLVDEDILTEELRIAIYKFPASLRFFTDSRWLEEMYYRDW